MDDFLKCLNSKMLILNARSNARFLDECLIRHSYIYVQYPRNIYIEYSRVYIICVGKRENDRSIFFRCDTHDTPKKANDSPKIQKKKNTPFSLPNLASTGGEVHQQKQRKNENHTALPNRKRSFIIIHHHHHHTRFLFGTNIPVLSNTLQNLVVTYSLFFVAHSKGIIYFYFFSAEF